MAKSQVLASLKGLSAVVTGGSSGLGLATVERLSKQGCIVAIIDLYEPKDLPANSYFIKADVSNEHDIIVALEIIERKATKLDILVNCAGIFLAKDVFDTETQTPQPLSDLERLLKVNTTGTFNMIRLCCSLFYKNKPNEDNQRGVIINTASVSAFEGPGSHTAYATSKGAIIGMTLPLARDLAKMGVRVMSIAPGPFLTPLCDVIPQDVKDILTLNTPFPQRFGYPDEFAHLVQAIIENPLLNGEVIRLDGAHRSTM